MPGDAKEAVLRPHATAPDSTETRAVHLEPPRDSRSKGKRCLPKRAIGGDAQGNRCGPLGVYTVFQNQGRAVAGMTNPTIDYTHRRGARWYAYVAVDDVDECARRVAELDGRVIEPPHNVPGVGRVCLIADPMGAEVTLASGWEQ
ncbi:MAG TPA: VOC family protein [Nitrospiraceae bacterium]|nr:VOC family protein [Nitrospiraceae bacterium]